MKLLKCLIKVELTKIAINIFLISSITCSNFISSLAKKINANWDDITKSLRLDKRIEKFAYLKPNMGHQEISKDLTTIMDIANTHNLIMIIQKFLKNYLIGNQNG